MSIIDVNGIKYDAEEVIDIDEKRNELEMIKLGKQKEITRLQNEIVQIDIDLTNL